MPTTRGVRGLEITAVTGTADPDRPRGLYVCEDRAADLPWVIARLPVRDAAGGIREWRYLLGGSADDPGTVISEAELMRGTAWPRLGLDVPGDAAIGEALAYVVRRMARELPVTELVPTWVDGQLVLPPAEVLPQGYLMTAGTAEEARVAWREIGEIACQVGAENLALNLGFAGGSPYLSALSAVDTQSVCVASIGQPRRGKTTNTYAAAGWFGAPKVLDPPLSESAIAVGDSLADLGCLPIFRDEVHAVDWSPADWKTFFMRTLNGAGRRRSASDGSGMVRHTRGWWGVQFLTGNTDPRFGETGGIAARVLVLSDPHLPGAAESKRVKKLLGLAHGWPFRWWLANHARPAEFAAARDRALAELYELGGVQVDSAETIAEALALAVAGAEQAGAMFGVPELRAAAVRGSLRVLDTLAGSLADAPSTFGDQLMQDVTDRVQAHPALWPPRADYEAMRSNTSAQTTEGVIVARLPEVQGFRWTHDGRDVVTMLRPVLEALADGRDYPRGEALAELKLTGQLITGGAARTLQHAIKINGVRERFYTFRGVVDEADSGTETAGANGGANTGANNQQASDLHGANGANGANTFPEGTPRDVEHPGVTPGSETRSGGSESDSAATTDSHPGCEKCGRWIMPSLRSGDGGRCQRPGCREDAPEVAPPTPVRGRYQKPDAGPQWTEARATVAAGGELRLLEILAGTCAPRRRVVADDGSTRLEIPQWRPNEPGITNLTEVPSYSWKRPYAGAVVVCDRGGAWLSAGSTCRVAHQGLTHTGPVELPEGEIVPGLYQVRNGRWEELDVMPSPLGNLRDAEVWVPEPIVSLLRDLARAGRWGGGEVEILDSYTAPGVRLNAGGWATGVNELRGWVLDTYGRDSHEYNKIMKPGYGQTISLMRGESVPGSGRRYKSRIGRVDWALTVASHDAATMWRRADAARILAPGAGPVAIQNVDEIVIPAEAFDLATIPYDAEDVAARDQGKVKALRIDQTGKQLGTFKVKAQEVFS